MSTATTGSPRYATLRDYLRVVRRNRWLILGIVIACGAVAFAVTARQKKTYQAQASVYFQDTTQYANLIGTQALATLPDATRAQINAENVTSFPVVQEAEKQLHSHGSLGGSISTFVNAQTNEVVIQATAPRPAVAQALANAFAEATKVVTRDQTRARFKSLTSGAELEFAQLNKATNDALTRAAYVDRIGTLKFLAQTADPVQVVQEAALPTTPTGPRTVRNTILGLLLGLTIALLVAFVRDALDRRLHSTVQISDELGWPILGRIRETAFGAPLFLNGTGSSSDAEGDREAFRILRQNLRFLNVDHPPKSVVVTSALAEEGKSSVAAALACSGAAAAVRTLLVECDLRRPSLAQRLGVNPRPGLSDFLLGDATPTEILQVVELSPPIPLNGDGPSLVFGNGAISSPQTALAPRRVVCITAGRRVPESAELLNSERFGQFLRDVESAYELVVLDASPLLSVADTSVLLPQAHATLLCVRAGRTTHDEAGALKQAVDRLPHHLVGVVVTGVKPGAEEDLGYYSYAYAHAGS